MLSIEQWLAANGVTVAPGIATAEAASVSDDGNTVVGSLTNSHAYLARVVPTDEPGQPNGGMIDLVDFNNSLYNASATTFQLLNIADLVLHGAHGSPMRKLIEPGQSSVWMTGDLGYSNHSSNLDGDSLAGEFGYNHAMGKGFQWGIAIGGIHDRDDLPQDGYFKTQGFYLAPEVMYNFYVNLYASFSGYYQRGSSDFRRGYLNAGEPVYSGADGIDSETIAGRFRVDWLNAFTIGAAMTPYASMSVAHTRLDGFTEHGGGFPAQWDSRSETETTFRGGIDATLPLSDRFTLLGNLEAGYRANSEGADAVVHVIGLYDLDMPGLSYRQTWLRSGAGIEVQVGPGTFSTMLNATTDGGSPAAYWLMASYRLVF